MKKYLLGFYILLFLSCKELDTKASDDNSKDYNTTITIYFKNEIDKKYAKFQQYDEFRLQDNGIIAPPKHTIQEQNLSTKINLFLSKPTLLLFGLNEFYIEPNNEIEIEYSVINETNEYFKDSIKLIKGFAALVTNGNDPILIDSSFIKNLHPNMKSTEINELLSEKKLTEKTNLLCTSFFTKNPYLQKSITAKANIVELTIQKNLIEIICKYNQIINKLNASEKDNMETCITSLTELYSNKISTKYWTYWFGVKKLYEEIIENKFKKNSFSTNSMQNVISNYDATTQQYLMLLAVKNNYKTKEIISLKIDEIKNKITDSTFANVLDKFSKRELKGSTLEDEVGNYSFYNYHMAKTSLNEIFKNSKQRFIYLDFCGTWCKPCINEIKEYSVLKKFDTSVHLKPIWIFFENDTTKWKSIIETYNLKIENCFIMINASKFQEKFGQQYLWEGEFPHHFLFFKDGNIVNRKAESLLELNLEKYILEIPNSPSPPPGTPR